MNEKRNIFKGKLQLPIGTRDWVEMARENACVDKTLLIQELVNRKTKVELAQK